MAIPKNVLRIIANARDPEYSSAHTFIIEGKEYKFQKAQEFSDEQLANAIVVDRYGYYIRRGLQNVESKKEFRHSSNTDWVKPEYMITIDQSDNNSVSNNESNAKSSNRLSVLPFVLFGTVGMQLITILIIASAFFSAYFSFQYNNQLAIILSFIVWMATLFAFINISTYISNYTRSLFVFHSNFRQFQKGPVKYTETVYTTGRKNMITGERPIIARTRERNGCNPLLMIVFMLNSLLIGVFGILAFIIDFIWILCSDRRVAQWNEVKEDMSHNISREGFAKFWRAPIVCILCIVIVWAGLLGCIAYDNAYYAPSDLEFTFTRADKQIRNNYMGDVYFYGEMKGAQKEIKQVNAKFYFKDSDGKLLLEDDFVRLELKGEDEHGNKTYIFRVETTISTSDSEEALALWEADLNNIEVSADIVSVEFKNGKHMFVPGEDIIIIKAAE